MVNNASLVQYPDFPRLQRQSSSCIDNRRNSMILMEASYGRPVRVSMRRVVGFMNVNRKQLDTERNGVPLPVFTISTCGIKD